MDDEEREEALEEAGLDPIDYEGCEDEPEFKAWEALQDSGLSLSIPFSMHPSESKGPRLHSRRPLWIHLELTDHAKAQSDQATVLRSPDRSTNHILPSGPRSTLFVQPEKPLASHRGFRPHFPPDINSYSSCVAALRASGRAFLYARMPRPFPPQMSDGIHQAN